MDLGGAFRYSTGFGAIEEANRSILREIKPERTDVKAEVTAFWSYDTNNQLLGKVRNTGKD